MTGLGHLILLTPRQDQVHQEEQSGTEEQSEEEDANAAGLLDRDCLVLTGGRGERLCVGRRREAAGGGTN